MKVGRVVLYVNTHRLTESDFCYDHDGHDVISRSKVLPPGECTHSISQAPMQQRSPVPD